MTQARSLLEPSPEIKILLGAHDPTKALSLFSSREMAYFLHTRILPQLGTTFKTRQLFACMEESFGLSMKSAPTVSMGKPGRRARWRQIVSDALTILLKEGYLKMIATRHYERI